MGKITIPVYDLQAVNRKQLHEEVVVETLSDILRVYDKLHSPHRNTFYQIVLITQGAGSQTIDFEYFKINSNQIYFIIPGQVRSWNFIGRVDGYVVNFTEKVFDSFIFNPFYLEQFPFLKGNPKDCFINLQKDTLKEVAGYIRHINNEIKKKDLFSLDLVCFQLISLFICIVRQNDLSVIKQVPEQNQDNLFNFRMLVNQYYKEKRLPKDYAAMLYVTPIRLNKLCQDLLGKSAGQIIRDKIILESKRLLLNTNISISEIAFQFNFTDNSYFTKFFKKYAGLTPEEFRKNHTSGFLLLNSPGVKPE